MSEPFTDHQTRSYVVQISEPLTMANRGDIARWCEDRGIPIGVPAAFTDPLLDQPPALIVTDRHDEERPAALGDRIVFDGLDADVVDQAHYKLWYEPIAERTEPS